MDIQIKKLTTVINQLNNKLEQLQQIQNFDYKQISDVMKLLLEVNQVNGEISLLIQSVINIDVSQLMDKIFNCLKNLLIHVLKNREQLNQKKIHQKSQSIQLIDVCVQNLGTQQSLLGGVAIQKQGNQALKVRNITQVPWYDTSQVIHVPKKFIDKYTCTTEDYYINCSKALSDQTIRQQEFESILQFANESIAMMGEALQNKISYEYKEKGKPEVLEKLMHAIKFKKEDLDKIMKSVDLDLLKDKVENYEYIEQEIKNHIIQVQKETAEKVFIFCKQLFKEQLKKGKYQVQNELNKQTNFQKGDECRCSIYVGEIVFLQNKIESQSQLANKQLLEMKEKDRIIQDMELQMKLFEGQLKQHIQEKQDLKQKLDQQLNIQRRGSVIQRQQSFAKNIQQIEEQNQDQQSQSPYRKMSREDKISQNRLTKSQILLPLQQLNENLDNAQISNLIHKDKMIERLIILINALDRLNKEKRLAQLQYVVESKGDRQLMDMIDLIKDIEDNDLQYKDTKSFCHSQQDFDDSHSPINMPKHYYSQHNIDQGGDSPSIRQKFQSTRDLNSPRIQRLEQIQEIDENKHILLIPIEQNVSKRKQSRNTSQSSFNDSNQQLDDVSPNIRQKQRLTRTQSNNQKIFENKTEKVKRTSSSIKLKINRKISNQNNSNNDILSNPYGTSTIQPLNSGSLTERLPLKNGILTDDQFKFDKNIENDDTQMKSSLNNNSLHDKTHNNALQSGLTTQHHTPNNSSRLTKLKSTNQNSDNVSQKYISNSKNVNEITNVQNTIQNLQLTKFQDLQNQVQDTFQIQEENDKLIKKQSLATHNNNQIQQSITQKESSSININNEIKKSQRSNQNPVIPNYDDNNGENSNRSIRKMSRQNMSPNSYQKTVGNESVNQQSYKQSLLDRLQSQNDLKPQFTNHNTQTSIENLESKKQDVFIKDYIKKQKEEFEKKQKEERVMFDQNLFDIAEQQEEQIIKYALNNTQGYMISHEIDDQIIKQMYQNLKDNGTQISQTINKFYQKQENQNIDFQDFKNFVSKFQNLHKRCGKDCIHVTRFYMRLGFIPIKYLNKRKAMRLAKPVVLPGFPKVS